MKIIEPGLWVNKDWKKQINLKLPAVSICDNNFSALPMDHIKDVIYFLKDHRKRVMIESGIDCKFVTKELADVLSEVTYASNNGFRMAFDRIEEDGIFQKAVQTLIDAGIDPGKFQVFVLFNFKDNPKEANYRMNECSKLKVRPYPQRFTPLNKKERDNKFINKYWTPGLLRLFWGYWGSGTYWAGSSKEGGVTFEDFLKTNISKSGRGKYKVKPEDWKAWNNCEFKGLNS